MPHYFFTIPRNGKVLQNWFLLSKHIRSKISRFMDLFKDVSKYFKTISNLELAHGSIRTILGNVLYRPEISQNPHWVMQSEIFGFQFSQTNWSMSLFLGYKLKVLFHGYFSCMHWISKKRCQIPRNFLCPSVAMGEGGGSTLLEKCCS